ncbi:fibronectin type III domain-containing protein [Natronobacterium gregoryi]|uniref:fibronectin type III domain-containing protein n=1 Tax=Natronobacterium gregoryi TaxID=44930 RepID=UPI0011137F51|nr:fibronectin type III domain-containing protein [Natronobacterium gregoryi]
MEATAISETSVSLEWTPHEDATSQDVVRQRQWGSEWSSQETIATLDSDVDAFEDDTVQPDRTYRYQVVAVLESGSTDESDWLSVETDDAGLNQHPAPPRGPHVEVDHPARSTPITPQALDVSRNPTINGYPRAEITVPYGDSWHSDALNDAEMRVWHSGDQQPIERLEHRRLEEGSGQKQTELEGKGGIQLEQRIVEDVDVEPTHEVVERILKTYTDYEIEVDEPRVDAEETVLQAADSDVELEQALEDAVQKAVEDDTYPIAIDEDGRIVPLQTAYWVNLTGDHPDDAYVTGSAAEVNAGESTSLEYTIPSEHVGWAARTGIHDETTNVRFELNGVNLISELSTGSSNSPTWFDVTGSAVEDPPDLDGGASPFYYRTEPDGDYRIDGTVIYDRRFHDVDDFSGEVHEPGGHLDRPHEIGTIPIDLEPITTPLSLTEVSLEVSMDDDQPAPLLGLGIDGTDDFDEVEDMSEHSLEYGELSTSARGRVSVGARSDSEPRDETPRYGYEPLALDTLELRGVLDSTPVLTNRSFDNRLMDVLQEVADIGNFAFEIRADDSGDLVVHWTQLEQRSSDADPDLASYEIDKQTEDVVERAIVYGGAARVTRQSVEVELEEWVDLPFPDSRLVERKETVYDPSEDDEYSRGEDYAIRYSTENGQPRIKALEDGGLDDGQTVRIDADVKPRGEFVQGDVRDGDARTVIEDIPGLASRQMCDQVALYLVEETGESIVDAEITVPHDEIGWSVIDAIDIPQLPGDGPWQVRDVDTDSSQTRITLGPGQTPDEAVSEIRDRISRSEERV